MIKLYLEQNFPDESESSSSISREDNLEESKEVEKAGVHFKSEEYETIEEEKETPDKNSVNIKIESVSGSFNSKNENTGKYNQKSSPLFTLYSLSLKT